MYTVRGNIEADWTFRNGKFVYSVTIPEGVSATFKGNTLSVGQNVFTIPLSEI